jgi:hypothetical protein
MKIHQLPFYCLGLALAVLSGTHGCSRRPAPDIDQVIAHFKDAGLEVKEPDYGPLSGEIKDAESGLNMVSELGPDRPKIRSVEIAGVFVTIHRFKASSAAESFYNALQNAPSLDEKMPARYREMVGTPLYVRHNNIVLRLNQKTNDPSNAAAIAQIKEKLPSL